MDLLLPEGAITWRKIGGNASSTIDLVFATDNIANRTISCGVREDLHHGSDHRPIATVLQVDWESSPPKERRKWKEANQIRLQQELAQALSELKNPLDTTEEIDASVDIFIRRCT